MTKAGKNYMASHHGTVKLSATVSQTIAGHKTHLTNDQGQDLQAEAQEEVGGQPARSGRQRVPSRGHSPSGPGKLGEGVGVLEHREVTAAELDRVDAEQLPGHEAL